QHRFGVAHRAGLAHKGDNPNMLVLSATPIPRTLALVLYNDLDLSVLDELPPGRQKITTAIIPPRREEDLFDYIAKCADSGVQSYIVCPLVEENEDYAARSAQEMYELMCQKTAPDNIGLIHGRMSAEEKQRVMDGFCGGDIKILVATTVIEVGVNVPSAVNMVIVDAERFGLAQLHQLRGRVGRGSAKSYCFLLSGEDNERLEIMTKSNDGFEIAEKDLMLRGPGDYLGQRQSGMPGTDFSALFADMELVMQAKEAASCIAGESRYSVLYEALRASLSAENDNMSKNITYN
ncbi:MAG: helicase-related protein, partial [Firmicutes bacterium]|nr:helicase-related protein [Bacillota bacterium]